MPFDSSAHFHHISEDHSQAIQLLENIGQQHILEAWIPDEAEAEKLALLDQVNALNQQYPGGLETYCANARRLLESSRRGDNPYEGCTPTVPAGESLDLDHPDFESLEDRGLELAGSTGFVLVAGGLGERLGYGGIKIELPLETVTERSFIESYIQTILAYQKKASSALGKELTVPLAIMTSGDTHDRTVSLLENNGYFGMKEEQLTIMKQEKVPSLVDNEARFSMATPYEIETKPHGHGDVHVLLHQTGTARRWLDMGIRYLLFFQDTNGIVFNAVAPALAVSEKNEFEVNSITVPRRAGEAAGGIVKLEKDDGSSLTINVEYNQLDPLLRATVNPEGDVADATGYSPYPGNINVLIFELAPYLKNLDASGGMIPEFVNPKYADQEKTQFKKPTRLECMMQDYPKLLGSEAKVGFTSFPRDLCFSAVKNNIVDAAAKSSSNLPAESGSSGEADVYAIFRRKLEAVGAQIETAEDITVQGVQFCPGPKVVIEPDFAMTLSELRAKVSGLKLSKGSTLVLRGEQSTVKDLNLEGRLILNTGCATGSVENKGDQLVELQEGEASEAIAIRGFRVEVLGADELG